MTTTNTDPDSRLAWFGQAPKRWNVILVSSAFSENSTRNNKMAEQKVLSLSYGRVVERDLSKNFGPLPESFSSYQILQPGDIVFRLTDMQNDHTSLRTGMVEHHGIITSAYVALRSRGPVDPA